MASNAASMAAVMAANKTCATTALRQASANKRHVIRSMARISATRNTYASSSLLLKRHHSFHSSSTIMMSMSQQQNQHTSGAGASSSTYHRQSRNFELSSQQMLVFSPLSSTTSSDYWHQWKTTMYQNIVWSLGPRGKGFGNFIPKQDKDDTQSDDGNSTTAKEDNGSTTTTKEDGSKGKGSSGNNNNNNGDEDPNTPPGGGLFAPFALLFLTYLLLNFGPDTSEEDNPNGDRGAREITWSDFCIHLLERGQVEKVVVTNQRTTARVFCKPGAPGMPYGGTNSSFSKRWKQQQRQQQRTPRRTGGGEDGSSEDHHNDEHHHHNAAFMEDSNEITMDNGTGVGNGGQQSQSQQQRPHQLVYRFAIPSVESFEKKMEEAQRSLGYTGQDEIPVQYAPDSTIATELLGMIPSFLLMGVMLLMLRGVGGGLGGMGGGGPPGGGGGGGGMGGIFQIGKSNAKKIKKDDINVTFKDVAGCQEAKKEIMEFVDFLMDPSRFTKLGAKIPKGALLTGPPGTGKTLLAKAVAGEASVPFYSISGSDFIEMFVGVGPSRVRDLFKEARANAPCIVFIDEIDAVGRQRGRGGVGGNDERENTLNQLLVEMDGFSPSTGVVVLAGTNRVDILDQALTRPGRFDRQITVDKPDLQGRKEIFQVHLQGITLEGDDMDDYAGRLAGLTPGFAGADIANICNEAAIVAARRKADAVSVDDFEKATDRIIGGLESNKIMSKKEREIVAHHEAGHAIAGWFLEHADPLLKVTIIPRSSGALGYAQYLPKEVFLRTEEQIMDIVCMALAGRAAEEIFFGKVTTGASDDLRRVTGLVYSTIQEYGMNNRLGQLAFPKDPNAMFDEKRYSERTAAVMDEEAKAVVDAAYQRTLELLREHKDELENLAKLLLEKETITHDDVVDLIGPRPFEGDPAYLEFISRKQQIHHEVEEEGKEEEPKKEEDPTNASGSAGGLNPGITS